MEINLLRTIRLSKKRLESYGIEDKGAFLIDNKIKFIYRVFVVLTSIPIFVNDNKRWYLSGIIYPESKTEKVFNELIQAGIKQDSISYEILKVKVIRSIIILFRIIFRLPVMLTFYLKNYEFFKKLDTATLHIIFGYVSYIRFFRKIIRKFIIICFIHSV